LVPPERIDPDPDPDPDPEGGAAQVRFGVTVIPLASRGHAAAVFRIGTIRSSTVVVSADVLDGWPVHG
jgi:hypothetical protein